jgi:hypothetical protein
VKDATIKACWYDVAPYAYFDLTKANVTDYGNAIKKYYRTLKILQQELTKLPHQRISLQQEDSYM